MLRAYAYAIFAITNIRFHADYAAPIRYMLHAPRCRRRCRFSLTIDDTLLPPYATPPLTPFLFIRFADCFRHYFAIISLMLRRRYCRALRAMPLRFSIRYALFTLIA